MKAFIINLERSKDRKALMQEEINKLFTQNPKLKDMLEFIFFKAVDGKNREHLEFKEHYYIWTSWIRAQDLTDGETACFASHYKLWQECVRLNEPIIVLEDDIAFNDNFTQEMLEKLHKYEYVRLCCIVDNKFYALEDNFFISFDDVAGTQGYYLEPSAANKFIKYAKFWTKPVDNYMDMSYFHKVLNIIYKPFPIKKLEYSTTIENRLVKQKRLKRITHSIFKRYFPLRRKIFTISMIKKLNLHKSKTIS